MAILALLFAGQANAQGTLPGVSLDEAISIAVGNNLSVESARLEKETAERLRHAGFDLSKTSITADYGQMNTVHNDTRFGVSQAFSFPSVYTNQRQTLESEYKASEEGYRLTEQAVRTAVRRRYYEYNTLLAQRTLLRRADSLYGEFADKSALRLRYGAANTLENTAASARRQQIAIQLRQVERDMEITLRQFNLLLQDSVIVKPDSIALRIEQATLLNDVAPESLPAASQLRYRQEAAHYRWRAERSRLLPDFTVGYNNQSLVGPQIVDNQEHYFTSTTRFNYLNAGITLPLFFRSQTAKIEASKLEYLRAGKASEQFNKQFDAALKDARTEVEKYRESLAYYETDGLRNAQTIIHAADQQFHAGEIDFLQWVILIDQGIALQSEYIQTLAAYNEAVISLKHLIHE
jgi:cobalt-zinc-cadmium resistance protein CzcA